MTCVVVSLQKSRMTKSSLTSSVDKSGSESDSEADTAASNMMKKKALAKMAKRAAGPSKKPISTKSNVSRVAYVTLPVAMFVQGYT